MEVSSICPYCGCGCRLIFLVKNQKIIKVIPDKKDEVSQGRPCIKGLTLHEVIGKDRILRPMIRESKNSKLLEVSWKRSYRFIWNRTKKLKPEEILFVISGKTPNEDCFTLREFAEKVFRTNQVDSCCTRLCHLITTEALKEFLGIDASPDKMDDVGNLDCLLIIGSNPASNYPVNFNRLLMAQNKGMKMITIQATENATSQRADMSLLIENGAEPALLKCIINKLISLRAYQPEIEKIEGFLELKKSVKLYTYKRIKKYTRFSFTEFNRLIRLIADSKRFGLMHGMGITQELRGRESVFLLLNLLILKEGKLLSSRGEINVQGASDIASIPLSDQPSRKNIIQALLISPVKAIFISGFNPAQSLPNLDRVHQNLRKMFVVQCEPHLNITSKFADVILPTPTLLERTGTITNGERRIRFVNKVIDPLGESKPEWIISTELAKIFGIEIGYKNEKEIFEKLVKEVPAYKNLIPNSIYQGNDAYGEKNIKFRRFHAVNLTPLKRVISRKYPFILTTFRSPFHFLTDEMTSKSKTLNRFSDDPCCYLNKKDAKKLKIKNGERIKVTSRVASLKTQAKIDQKIPEGMVGMYFHSKDLLVNRLFPSRFDKVTFVPYYKTVAVNIEKIYS
ncbi:MAG: molybdopterin-dependent oxidoreductase [Nitrososphaeria archaeon]|jgi:predicted molibdopterin-dependent oxidoreductase YjgC